MNHIIKVVIGIVILGVVGAGVCLGARVWDPIWNPFRPSPEKVIEEMLTNMEEVKTLHSKGEIDITSKEGVSEFNLSIGFEGDSNAIDSENPKSAGSFDITTTVNGIQFSSAMESKIISNITYLKLNTLVVPPDLESLLLMFGINLNEIKGQWIKIDKEAMENLTGQTYVPQETSKDEQEKMIKKLQELFAERKIYYIEKEMPDEKINGKEAYHYLLALDKEEIKKITPELFEVIKESSGQSLGWGSGTTFIAGIFSELFDKLGDITAEMWIGKKDKLLYKIEGEKEIDLSKFNEKDEGVINLKIVFNFSNFNQPVEIKAPEISKSLEEILVIPQILSPLIGY